MWTQERIDNLKKWAAEGVSYGVIAERLGMTRNSVIGKANREKLPPRIGNIREAAFRNRVENQRKRERREQKAMELAAKRAQAPIKVLRADVDLKALIAIPTNDFLSQRKGGCKWPHGELCQNDAVSMRPYCADHEAQSRA